MSSLTFVRYLIECDGCEAVFGTRQGFESLAEARAVAYAAGWRFPNQLTAKGGLSTATSDVCAKCEPAWTLQHPGEKAGRMRMLTKGELAKLALAESGAAT